MSYGKGSQGFTNSRSEQYVGGGDFGSGALFGKILPGLTVLLLMFSPLLPGKRGFKNTGKPPTSVSHLAITYPFQNGEVALSDACAGC